MEASTVSAGVAAFAAVVSCATAWNARRSARTARAAFEETARQGQVSAARYRLGQTEQVFSDAMRLIDALRRDLPLHPGRVEPLKDALRGSLQAAELSSASVRELIAMRTPPSREQADRIKAELLRTLGELRTELDRS